MDEMDDISERKSQEQFGSTERRLKAQKILYLFRKRAGRFFLVFSILSVVFVCAAIVQGWFVRAQLYQTTKRGLESWAATVAKEIAYKDKWDLSGYRNALILVPSWDVVTKDGLIVDSEGFMSGLFGKAEPMPESFYGKPTTFVSPIGETWRLFGKKIVGGFVVVGISPPEDTNYDDALLLTNAAKFGSTLDEATSVKSRQIDYDVDFAVIGANGELKNVLGGIPLKINLRNPPPPNDQMTPLVSEGKSYMVLFHPLLDTHGQVVGEVIVPKEMGLEMEALRAQKRFNYMMAGISFLVAIIAVLWLAVREILPQTKCVTLEEAIRVGESATVEFKSTFHWDVRQGKPVDERQLDVLKSIAGFLNARGGTLFIGVSEDETPPTARGIDEDLKLAKGSKDWLQRKLRDLITTRIGPEFSPFINTDGWEERGGKLCWVIVVEESPAPAFVRWKAAGEAKEQKRFFIREGPKTSDLDNEGTWHYIKNKWG